MKLHHGLLLLLAATLAGGAQPLQRGKAQVATAGQEGRDHRRPGQARGRSASRRRRQRRLGQGDAELSRISEAAEHRSAAARRGDAATGRPEPGIRRARPHVDRSDAGRHAGRRGHHALWHAAQGLSGLRAQRPGALPAGARLRDHWPAGAGAGNARSHRQRLPAHARNCRSAFPPRRAAVFGQALWRS